MWSGGFERGGECSEGRVWPLGIDEPLGQDFSVRSSDCRQLPGDLIRFQVHLVKTFSQIHYCNPTPMILGIESLTRQLVALKS